MFILGFILGTLVGILLTACVVASGRKENRMNKEFWKASLIRALRTICQTAIATIGTAVVLTDVNWKYVVSASILAGLLSILTSISTGLPEVQLADTLYALDNDGEIEPNNHIEDEDYIFDEGDE